MDVFFACGVGTEIGPAACAANGGAVVDFAASGKFASAVADGAASALAITRIAAAATSVCSQAVSGTAKVRVA